MLLEPTPENLHRFWSKVDLSNPFGCWLWTAGTKDKGYGAFWVVDRMESAQRVAWELLRGQIPEGLCVLHRCDNPPCVCPSHLFLGTVLQNNEDMFAKGRNYTGGAIDPARGEEHWQAVFTDLAVLEIRRARKQGVKLEVLAQRFGASVPAVSEAATGKKWTHLDVLEAPVEKYLRGRA